jgi:hypothetical protein
MAADRSDWLNDLVSTGGWDAIRRLRKGFVKHQGRLRNTSGNLVSSEERSDTLGKYLQDVQWAVRPTSLLPPKPTLFERLPVNLDDITHDEVMHAGAKLRRKRAAGPDDFPPEFWEKPLPSEVRQRYLGRRSSAWRAGGRRVFLMFGVTLELLVSLRRAMLPTVVTIGRYHFFQLGISYLRLSYCRDYDIQEPSIDCGRRSLVLGRRVARKTQFS